MSRVDDVWWKLLDPLLFKKCLGEVVQLRTALHSAARKDRTFAELLHAQAAQQESRAAAAAAALGLGHMPVREEMCVLVVPCAADREAVSRMGNKLCGLFDLAELHFRIFSAQVPLQQLLFQKLEHERSSTLRILRRAPPSQQHGAAASAASAAAADAAKGGYGGRGAAPKPADRYLLEERASGSGGAWRRYDSAPARAPAAAQGGGKGGAAGRVGQDGSDEASGAEA